jgi:3-methyladenine DNA glycosylase AlkD
MKSLEPFYGVRLPEVRRIAATVVADRATAEALWDGATHREERYAAIALLEDARRALTPDDLPLLERLIVEGAWWDLVDPLSALAGSLLPAVESDMRAWARSEDMEAARVDHLPAQAEGDDRPRPPARLHRAEPRRPRVLHP